MNKTAAIVIIIIGVLISSFTQLLLKKSSEKSYKNVVFEYINPYVIISYGVFLIITFITVIMLKHINISLVPVLESTSFIFITILSSVFLKEKISKKQLFFLGIILLGIIIFAGF